MSMHFFGKVMVNLFFFISKPGRSARVFCHSQVVENQSDIACQLSHFLCDAAYAFGFYFQWRIPEPGHVFRAVAGAYPAAIFIVVPIDDVVAAIFDAPMTAVNVENTLCVGLLRCSTGDAVCRSGESLRCYLHREPPQGRLVEKQGQNNTAKKVAIYLMKRYTCLDNKEIGQVFGGLHYSAVSQTGKRVVQG
jgi:hypothetical protein